MDLQTKSYDDLKLDLQKSYQKELKTRIQELEDVKMIKQEEVKSQLQMRMVKEIEEINKKFEDQLKKKGENLQKVLKQMESEFL